MKLFACFILSLAVLSFTAAKSEAAQSLPPKAQSALRGYFPELAKSKLSPSSQVYKLFFQGEVPSSPNTPTGGCFSSYITVLADPFFGIMLDNTGSITYSCATYENGQLILQGQGFEKASWVDLNSMYNIYVSRAPFAVTQSGQKLLVDVKEAACLEKEVGYTYTPWVIYIGTGDGTNENPHGYFALIGSFFEVEC